VFVSLPDPDSLFFLGNVVSFQNSGHRFPGERYETRPGEPLGWSWHSAGDESGNGVEGGHPEHLDLEFLSNFRSFELAFSRNHNADGGGGQFPEPVRGPSGMSESGHIGTNEKEHHVGFANHAVLPGCPRLETPAVGDEIAFPDDHIGGRETEFTVKRYCRIGTCRSDENIETAGKLLYVIAVVDRFHTSLTLPHDQAGHSDASRQAESASEVTS
jgi:hypothetical protein